MKEQFIVKMWSNRSESTYFYGPFFKFDAAQKFVELLPEHYTEATIEYLNAPTVPFNEALS